MRTREITHERWPHFLGDFTQLHQGEHVNVETIGEGVFGVRSQMCDQPLIGIVGADPKARCGEWIEIIAGDSPATQATLSIPHPSHVVIAEEEDGQGVALQIDSADGSITMVRFEPPLEGMPAGFTLV
jgi:TusA-related sulfurtransferase